MGDISFHDGPGGGSKRENKHPLAALLEGGPFLSGGEDLWIVI